MKPRLKIHSNPAAVAAAAAADAWCGCFFMLLLLLLLPPMLLLATAATRSASHPSSLAASDAAAASAAASAAGDDDSIIHTLHHALVNVTSCCSSTNRVALLLAPALSNNCSTNTRVTTPAQLHLHKSVFVPVAKTASDAAVPARLLTRRNHGAWGMLRLVPLLQRAGCREQVWDGVPTRGVAALQAIGIKLRTRAPRCIGSTQHAHGAPHHTPSFPPPPTPTHPFCLCRV